MKLPIVLLVLGTVSLSGCDAASDIAGDALEGELRNAVTAQCQQVAENASIAAPRISQVCECVADTYIEDPDLTLDDISRERVTSIVNDCAASTDPDLETIESIPAEEAGG
ncbi:hypothetical protein [Aurantiacibacter hainanensis]|uniref:hypothetical protein n=1 Tax=Aurantiacibacter hainanensis TaxID=3076114 RepID=UPI0030C6882C